MLFRSRTALEAHAGGAALISSGTGGLAEISGDAALMLPEVTPDAIASAIAMLIVDQPLRESLAHKGAAHARAHLGIEAQAARLDAFYATIARQGDATRRSNCPPAVHFQHDARH